ncbi:pyridoxamine 5'-phosphate oxidase family protein [Sulfitobacter pseudonitzschiae]|uniref:Pyridoxamine 5'-phosphate oxidase family protein n=1 Tax=Pseudosulfitobacter pseudonitzschiae TaxID=1402135 RepID=A0A9Q2RV07_9RHOB|nr:pyridoxamine 5'-phosphate oxidase family protein [Pseudosulfitobacter pseudonitzschiae]MBM2291701.1 pyridoxamine 5'-phosphate oxidase family protein [Pseudosulfitobacter pseudonitzschiae]MBM2296619.1 pyridoxamine 5'-phosphate oxidase family protein [Pseudosulfitobacter pseudonitzschiae]MBM2301532.1 pyridoxamine 5'-phosphate oxidase family protein [Pseudosulfitobacter pseudonitzschiae]MBM2311316.1 pyridoxamine 5'-phosphate oxidase family protein [Pseudosulfitobacter pseudonitzschiae]MBM23162
MQWIEKESALEALYGTPGQPALRKVSDHLTPLYRKWIMASRFCVLTTVGAAGTDGSPRGDDGPVVLELDPQTLAMPDWRGNNRLDSLRNIVTDGRVSLMFMVPGSNTVVRVNGQARLTDDADLRARFAAGKATPATVIVIRIAKVYTQCARAVMRADLWARDDSAGLPRPGEILAEVTDGAEGGAAYDAAWPKRASETMW